MGLALSRMHLGGTSGSLHLPKGTVLPQSATVVTAIRGVGMTYGIAVLMYMYGQVGAYPLASYTMQAWTTATLRYTFGEIIAMKSRY